MVVILIVMAVIFSAVLAASYSVLVRISAQCRNLEEKYDELLQRYDTVLPYEILELMHRFADIRDLKAEEEDYRAAEVYDSYVKALSQLIVRKDKNRQDINFNYEK